jgi:hypothetical protein
MERGNLFERSTRLGERLRKDVSPLEDHPDVGEIRSKGLLFGIELVESGESRRPAGPGTVGGVMCACKRRGLVIGKNGDTVAGHNNVAKVGHTAEEKRGADYGAMLSGVSICGQVRLSGGTDFVLRLRRFDKISLR